MHTVASLKKALALLHAGDAGAFPKDAVKLYGEAAACEAEDAMERLDAEMAKEELED